jgi:carboxyl-terminal processing protease
MKSLIVALCMVCAGGAASAETVSPSPDLQTFEDAAAAISETMHRYHYNPSVLDDPSYRAIEARVATLAAQPQSREDFVSNFNRIWRDGPFSHVSLAVAQASADDVAAYLDTIRVGGDGAVLTWNGDVAILTVTTMMGLDTIEQIDAAFEALTERGASALIIDLRENGGGAFAIRPLIGHLINEPFDAGLFTSQRWSSVHDGPPTRDDALDVAPWQGWSIRAFWRDAQNDALVKVQLEPMAPVFEGPVFVLTSQRTASAAELATDALKASGRAVQIGERTAGEMLSQKMYDISQGLQLSLPIADYVSLATGRIEGVGIAPDIETDANEAMAVALERAAGAER